MKRILIALDYNRSAHKVAKLGHEIAGAMGAKPTLLHILTQPEFYLAEYAASGESQTFNASVAEEIFESTKHYAERFLVALARDMGMPEAETIVYEGNTEDGILHLAEKLRADLIILGSHRHRGLQKIFTPDLAVHILRRSRIPLLAIPTED